MNLGSRLRSEEADPTAGFAVGVGVEYEYRTALLAPQRVGRRGLQLPRCQPSLFGEMSWLAVRLLLELSCGWKQHIRAEGLSGRVQHWRMLNH